MLKGCVCYIFTSLFCMPKREDLQNKEKCFLFHFESSFCYSDNQILNFQNNLESTQPGNEIWPVYVILKGNLFYHKTIWKMWPGN